MPEVPDLSGHGRIPATLPGQVRDSNPHEPRSPRLVGAGLHPGNPPRTSPELQPARTGAPDLSGQGRVRVSLPGQLRNSSPHEPRSPRLVGAGPHPGNLPRTSPGLQPVRTGVPDLSGQGRVRVSLPGQVRNSNPHEPRSPRLVGAGLHPGNLPRTSPELQPARTGVHDLSGQGRVRVSLPGQVRDSNLYAPAESPTCRGRAASRQPSPDKSGTPTCTHPRSPRPVGAWPRTGEPSRTSPGLQPARTGVPDLSAQGRALGQRPRKSPELRYHPGGRDAMKPCRACSAAAASTAHGATPASTRAVGSSSVQAPAGTR